jgi:hypothetical protein
VKYIKLFEEFSADLIVEKKEIIDGTLKIQATVDKTQSEDLKKGWEKVKKDTDSTFKLSSAGFPGGKTVEITFQKNDIGTLKSVIDELISAGESIQVTRWSEKERYFDYKFTTGDKAEMDLVDQAQTSNAEKKKLFNDKIKIRNTAFAKGIEALKDGKSMKDAQEIILKTAKSLANGIDFLITKDGETEADFVSNLSNYAPKDYVDVSIVFDELKQEMKKFGANLVSADEDTLSFDGEDTKGYYQIEVIYADGVLYINNGATQEEVYTISNNINAKSIMSNIKKGISSKKLLSK